MPRVAWTRTDVHIYQTRLRGMFATGGEVYRWFGRHVTPFIAREMRQEVAQHTRTGRLLRSLYSRTEGTNQYLLHVVAGSTAGHARYFINDTRDGGLIMPTGGSYMMLGLQHKMGIPWGGPTGAGAPAVMRADAVHGYEGNDFIGDAVTSVLRRRRLL